MELVDLWFCHTTSELSATRQRVNDAACVHLARRAIAGEDISNRFCEICEPRQKVIVPRRYPVVAPLDSPISPLLNENCDQILSSSMQCVTLHDDDSKQTIDWRCPRDAMAVGCLDVCVHREHLQNVRFVTSSQAPPSIRSSPLRHRLGKLLDYENDASTRIECMGCNRTLGSVENDICKLWKKDLYCQMESSNLFSVYTVLTTLAQTLTTRAQSLGQPWLTVCQRSRISPRTSFPLHEHPEVWSSAQCIPLADASTLKFTALGTSAIASSNLQQRALTHTLADINGQYYFHFSCIDSLLLNNTIDIASMPITKCSIQLDAHPDESSLWLDFEEFQMLYSWLRDQGVLASALCEGKVSHFLPSLSRTLLFLMD